MMASAISEVRGLGLFVRPSADVTAETLRTLIAIHRNLPTDRVEGSPEGDQPSYELIFVRARTDSEDSPGAKILADAFATSDRASG